MKYIVLEIQTWDTGATSTPAWAYDDLLKAESKFHSVLAAAALSELPMHAAVLMQADGMLLNRGSYEHVQPEPEPAPESEPEEVVV